MYTILLKIAFIGVSMVLGVHQLCLGEHVNGVFILMMATAFLYDYVSHGLAWFVYQQLRRGNFREGERLLNRVRNPHRLPKNQMAYFFFSCGLIALRNGRVREAEESFNKALETRVLQSYDLAVLHLKMASVKHLLGQKEQAWAHLDIAKRHFLTEMQKTESLDLEKSCPEFTSVNSSF